MKQVEKLLSYFVQFQLTDILAFGNILGVEEQDLFEDYVTNICEAFTKQLPLADTHNGTLGEF